VEYTLSQNYPNPFNPTTNLEFGISDLGFVSLKIYDMLGKEVKTLVNETKPAGRYTVTFDGSNLASGIYYYQIKAGDFIQTKRMMLIK
jgi:5-hydroxyisourate hydrolase-like protein (transthyretin family)